MHEKTDLDRFRALLSRGNIPQDLTNGFGAVKKVTIAATLTPARKATFHFNAAGTLERIDITP